MNFLRSDVGYSDVYMPIFCAHAKKKCATPVPLLFTSVFTHRNVNSIIPHRRWWFVSLRSASYYNDKRSSYGKSQFIIIVWISRALSLVERACCERARAQSWATAVKPSANLNYVRPFPGLFSSFFSLIESEISEQASRQVTTEQPNKGL